MFNTLKYAKILEEVGFSREQAETTIKILVEVMEDKLATKQDFQQLQASTKQDIQQLQASTKQDIQQLQASTKQEIQQLRLDTQHSLQQLKAELIIKMGAMQAAAVGLIVALIKLL